MLVSVEDAERRERLGVYNKHHNNNASSLVSASRPSCHAYCSCKLIDRVHEQSNVCLHTRPGVLLSAEHAVVPPSAALGTLGVVVVYKSSRCPTSFINATGWTQRRLLRYTVLPRKKKSSCMQTHASHITSSSQVLRLGPYTLPRVHNVAAAPTARLQPTNANSALQYLLAYACTAVHHACAPMTHDSLHMQQQTHVRGAL